MANKIINFNNNSFAERKISGFFPLTLFIAEQELLPPENKPRALVSVSSRINSDNIVLGR